MVDYRQTNSIERGPGPSGLDLIVMRHSSGYRATVSEYGGQVLSWIHPSERELLFLSDKATYESGKAIRGGIPIVFPQFGKGDLPAHGFARTAMWRIVREQVRDAGPVSLGLRLNSDSSTCKMWPHQFALELDIELSETLLMVLRVTNTGEAPFSFSSALHTYFAVGDVAKCKVLGLKRGSYVDFLAQGERRYQDSPELLVRGPIDRAYERSSDSVVLEDVDRLCVLKITKEGFADTVVWNPWAEGSLSIADLAPEAWRSMLCIESGNVIVPITVLPGNSHTSAQIIRAEIQE